MNWKARALHTVAHLTRLGPARAFDTAADDVDAAQLATLHRILGGLSTTELGKARGYASIRTHDDLQQVPIFEHGDYAPFIAREMAGERQVLVPEQADYFAMTTGTTSAAKHVPITDAYRREFQTTAAVAMKHLRDRFPSAFFGRALYFVGSADLGRTDGGATIGTMSGYNFTRMPAPVRAIYAWPAELFHVTDADARAWLALHLALIGDVSVVIGIYPASIISLLRTLEQRALALADAIEGGVIPDDIVLEPALRAVLAAMIRPRPDVAAAVRVSATLPRGERVARCFPRLALVYCWKTSTAGAFVDELQSHLGPTIAMRDAIYAACECWLTVPMGDDEPGGALAITSAYFEFVPEDAWFAGERRTLRASQLNDGQRYVVLTSASNGLVRYQLNDVVEVRGFYRSVPRIAFVRKAGAQTNLMGEKLTEEHITRALTAALADTGQRATWACAVATLPTQSDDLPRYDLWVEPEDSLDDVRAAALRERFAERLGEAAVEIPRLRKSGQLGPVGLVRVRAGAYEGFRRRRIAEGCADAQLKVVHLVLGADALPAEIGAARVD
jgi:hypothetical protein